MPLITLTTTEDKAIDIASETVRKVEIAEGGGALVTTGGDTIEVRETQARIREMVNRIRPKYEV